MRVFQSREGKSAQAVRVGCARPNRAVVRVTALLLCLGITLPWSLSSQSSPTRAADIAHEVLAAGLDPTECYHVRDLQIHQDDATFYLTEGYLILGKPVDGAPITAVFTTDVEGGDGEAVLRCARSRGAPHARIVHRVAESR